MSSLKTLWLADTRVTDAGLRQLKGLANLENLNLEGTQVTDIGVKDLAKALPKLKIRR